MKKLLISTLLAVGLVSPALAKDMANHSAPAASSPAPVASWFGHVEGGYVFPASSHTKELGAPFTGFDDAHMGNGGYGSAKLGYHINDLWDIAVGFKYLEQSSGRINDDGYNWQATSGRYWNLDFEVGRRIEAAGWLLRPFGGLRYQEYDADFRDHLGVTFSARETSWGLGPRIGIDVFRNLGGDLSFFGSADASVLFGRIKADQNYGKTIRSSDSRTFFTTGLKAGLAWELAPGVKLGGGYQLEYLSGLGYKSFSSGPVASAGHASQLIHGPFLRLSFNY